MSKLRPIQHTFKSGEITPKLRSRPDTGEYIQGVEFMENFITSPYGSAIRRTGSELIEEVSNTLLFGRIFPFRVEGSESYIVVVTEDSVAVYDRSGQLPTDPAGGSDLENPGFNEGGDGWNVNLLKQTSDSLDQEPRITFLDGFCNIQSGNAADIEVELVGDPLEPEPQFTVVIRACSAELTQQITVGAGEGADNFALNISVADGSFFAQGILLDYLSIGTTESANDIPFTIDPVNSSTALFSPGVDTFWISYKLDWNDSTNITVDGPLHTPPLPPPPNPGNVGSSAIVRIDSFILINLDAPAILNVTFPSPYTEQQVKELQVEKAPGLSTMYFVVRSTFTHKKLIFDRILNTWTFIDVNYIGGVDDPPNEWISTGYPGTITFFQGRMWLGGSVGHPATVWGSVSGEDNFEDFSVSGATDDDALELPLARDGVIQWIQGGKALSVGTDTAEHIIFGNAQFELLTPSNARATQHSAYGSARIHAEWLSEKITFVSQDGRRLYISDYDRETFGFQSDEISYMAEHMTQPGIVEVAYAQNPRAHVWAVKIDGEMIGCTYQRETEAVGWHRRTTPLGNFLSITTTEEFGRTVLWFLIVRENKLYLERESRDVYLDFHITRQYDPPQNVVDGLEHLEGLLVDAIADGAYAGRFVVENGEITTNIFANTFFVGLPYVSTLITLPVEQLTPADNLTAKLVRWNRIYVRLLDSIIPIINGVLPPDRSPSTPMDTREANSTQDVSVATTGFDRDAEITIIQDLPFACEIVGLYGELREDGFD